MLRGAPEIPANLRITGLRGVGKSVLLKEFERLARDEGWAVVRHQLEPRHNTDESLGQLIARSVEAAKSKMSRTRRVKAQIAGSVDAGRRPITVSIEDVTFSLGGDPQVEPDLVKNLYGAVEAALDTGHEGFALLLDEAQVIRDDTTREGEHPVSMLVAAVNALQEAGLPLVIVMCGLPTLRTNLQRARTYSERMFRGEHIGELEGNPGPARDAFVEPLKDTGVVAEEHLISRLLDAIEPDIYRRLDDEFYAGRVEILTPSEQDLLIATAACSYPPLKTADIRQRSAKSGGNINVLMGRLAEQGVLYRIQEGQYAYTAPKFHEYLIRRVSLDAATRHG